MPFRNRLGISSAVFPHNPRNIVLGVAGSSTAFETIREQVLPGLFLKPFAQSFLGEFIDGFTRSLRLRPQFGHPFVRDVDAVLGCHGALLSSLPYRLRGW